MSATQIIPKDQIAFVDVWPGRGKAWEADIRQLWDTHREAREIGSADKRIDSAVMVLVAAGRVVGLSTAYARQVGLLNHNWLYEFRIFIAPHARQPGLDAKLIQESVSILEQSAQTDPHKPIGVLAQLQNEKLMQSPSATPILRLAPFYLIGYTSKGYPIRVLYFDGASI
jgi:hypothetical protein